jgi:hypothetical protein
MSTFRIALRSFVLVAISVSCLTGLLRIATAPRGPVGNDVDRAVEGYLRVAPIVPKNRVVGFLSFAPDEPTVVMQLFIAQNAMAPRVLARSLDQAAFVVTAPNAPELADEDPRLAAFERISRGPEGILVFRRRP